MTNRLFEDPAFPSVPVLGGDDAYPVHRIFCVGRNYEDHAKEMGDTVDRESPFYFMKDAQSVVASGSSIPYPPGTQNLHHEVELVVYIGAALFKADVDAAGRAVFGYGVGLDMTRRDLQNVAKSKGRPWDFGKNFEKSSVLTSITRARDFTPDGQRIWLDVDGATRQEGKLNDMVWSVAEVLSDLSHYYHLAPGDVVMTGTPAGVGAVSVGSELSGGVEGLSPIRLTITAAE